MFLEMWQSFRRLPLWVQIWIAVILVPINAVPALFWLQGASAWGLISLLSVSGMALNLPILFKTHGFSKAMAIPHVLLWTPLVILLAQIVMQDGFVASGSLREMTLAALLVVNVISLAFDFVDAWKWWHGDRAIA
ncbi:MAG: hypothetical protein ACU0BB_08285 [Paracoccaceae bacterium]